MKRFRNITNGNEKRKKENKYRLVISLITPQAVYKNLSDFRFHCYTFVVIHLCSIHLLYKQVQKKAPTLLSMGLIKEACVRYEYGCARQRIYWLMIPKVLMRYQPPQNFLYN